MLSLTIILFKSMRRTSKCVNHAKEVYWRFHLTFERWYHMTWQKRPNIGFAGFKLPWIQTLSLYWDYWQLTSKINPLKNCSQFELWMSNLLRFSQISLIPAKSAENIKLWSETNWSKDGGEGDGNKTHIPGKNDVTSPSTVSSKKRSNQRDNL